MSWRRRGLQPRVKAVVCVTTDKVYADHDRQDGIAKAIGSAARSLCGLQGGGRAGRCMLSRHDGGAREQGADRDGARRQHHRRRRLVARPDRARFRAGGGRGRATDAAQPGCGAALAACAGAGARLSRAGEPAASKGTHPARSAWNFGPRDGDAVPVQELVERLGKAWKRPEINLARGDFPETHFLHLDSAKARASSAGSPPLDFADAVPLTAEWYREFYVRPSAAAELTAAQINHYRQRLSQEHRLSLNQAIIAPEISHERLACAGHGRKRVHRPASGRCVARGEDAGRPTHSSREARPGHRANAPAPKKLNAELRQTQKHRHAVTDPLVNPGSPPHRHQTRSKADPTRTHHRKVTLALSSPGGHSARATDDHAQWEAFGIDQGVELASFDLLSGLVTHCVVFTPVFTAPFSADFSDWLSMIAAVGLASRPACSRRAKSTSAQIASQVRKML